MNQQLGVSIVICCHNGAQRLPATLEHLAAQQAPDEIPWEVILIDNASTDGSAEVARGCWPANPRAPLRVIHEPRLGLSNARAAGFREARYEIVSFVDDDNWVPAEWVRTVSEVMSRDPEIGALGSFIEPVFAHEPPSWFEQYEGFFGNLTERNWMRRPPAALWGAGLTVRKQAWERLVADGFVASLTGRRGRALSSGEDLEITYALALAGWRLHFERSLRLKHFMPSNRLTWGYLRRLARQISASVQLEAYYFVDQPDHGISNRLRQFWSWHAAATAVKLIPHWRKLVVMSCTAGEGDPEIIELEKSVGRLIGLVRARGGYRIARRSVREARWRRRKSLLEPTVREDAQIHGNDCTPGNESIQKAARLGKLEA